MTLPRLIPTAEPTQQAQTKGPFSLTAFVLWILALCGIFLVILTWLPLRIKRSLLHRELLAISVAHHFAERRVRDITTVPTPAMGSLSRCIAGGGVDYTTRATARLTDL
jgi:hypothetical protein